MLVILVTPHSESFIVAPADDRLVIVRRKLYTHHLAKMATQYRDIHRMKFIHSLIDAPNFDGAVESARQKRDALLLRPRNVVDRGTWKRANNITTYTMYDDTSTR